MERNLKFKVGDKVKVIATKEQLKEIGILDTWDDELFNEEIYVENLVVKSIKKDKYLPYLLNNGFFFKEEYLEYTD